MALCVVVVISLDCTEHQHISTFPHPVCGCDCVHVCNIMETEHIDMHSDTNVGVGVSSVW